MPRLSSVFPYVLWLLTIISATSLQASPRVTPSDRVILPGHIPHRAIDHAAILGRLKATESVQLALVLPLRDPTGLDDLLRRLSDPLDPLHGHYLSADAFASRFGPTAQDYEAVATFAMAQGFFVIRRHSNRLVLDVLAPSGAVEKAFQVKLLHFQAPDGHHFHAPDAEPSIPASLAGRLSSIVGLENAAVWHTHARRLLQSSGKRSPRQVGTGPGGGLTPSNIKTAYNLASVSSPGAGQVLGLFELDGYAASDIRSYESSYGLPAIPLQNVLVDGASGTAGSGADEVTLDIELATALASAASKCLVYEGPNSNAGVLDTYNRIATDNQAKQVATCWGLSEDQSSSSALSSENAIFKEMAAQGQSIFAASGDSGAYDNGSTLSVDDPASQPYMVGVGGTHLVLRSSGAYSSESTWNGGSVSAGASGGGISQVWSIPSYQQAVVSAASYGSTAMRNVPDVSLDADPNTGYSIFVGGQWWIYGGTSCATPLWAAFAALVNQQRAAAGNALLGFANPALYASGTSSSYTTQFHDIANGSTNLYYPAVTGFDDATGWGSFNGANLLAALGGSSTSSVPAAPTNLTATPGNAQVTLSWSGSSGATSYNLKRSTTSGSGYVTVATGITGTSATNTSLTNGTTYYYVVSAVNSVGESANSNQASATPSATVTVAAPTGLTAVAGDGKVSLSWQSSAGATSYNLKRSTSSAGPYSTVATGLTVTSATDGGLTDGTTYYYVVSAISSGVESANSSPVSATPKLAAPTGLTVYAVSSGQINMYWTNSTPNATAILVEYATAYSGWYQIGSLPPTTTACYVTGLYYGTTYYFRIRASNGASTSAYSNTAWATTYW